MVPLKNIESQAVLLPDLQGDSVPDLLVATLPTDEVCLFLHNTGQFIVRFHCSMTESITKLDRLNVLTAAATALIHSTCCAVNKQKTNAYI